MEIICYTREPLDDKLYAPSLAFSVHFAYRNNNNVFTPFHHNEGIVYAKASSNPDGTLEAKSVKKPWLFRTEDGNFALVGIRTTSEGNVDNESCGCIILWKSRDLVHFTESPLFRLQEKGEIQEVRCLYDKEKMSYCICWQNSEGEWITAETKFLSEKLSGYTEKTDMPSIAAPFYSEIETSGIEGIKEGNSIQISEKEGVYLCRKFLVPHCTEIKITEKPVRASAIYNDGTSVLRKIDWNARPENNGDTILGRIHQEQFDFPFAVNRADPCCIYKNGKYYFIATNDADGNHTLYIRCSDTLEDIKNAPEKLLLDSTMYKDIGALLWAPEFHEIEGKLYIFLAATEKEFFREASRVMTLKDGGNIMKKEDWSAPRLVIRRDGTPLCSAGKVISLDMTTFCYEQKVYAVWSQRQFLPVDQGAWLFIAEISAQETWQLVSDPVCLIKPEYGWENNHTFVTEGPFVIEHGKNLMLTYSAAAVDTTYTVGLLRHIPGTDVTNPDSWIKNNYPLLSSRSVSGEYGPGHNSYVTDENGLVWNFYHARKGLNAPRSSGARRVHFDTDGEPMLDVTESYDLPENMRDVSAPFAQL